MMNILAYADGEHDLLSIAHMIGEDVDTCAQISERLVAEGLLEPADTG